MKCIICRNVKEDSDFSDEHVIPDSLGGYYHIYTVCKSCNSKLGENVDAPLVNHKLSEIYRFSQEIVGKSGKLPNPFSGTFSHKDTPNRKARIDINKKRELELYYPPETIWQEVDGRLILSIAVDPKDENKINKILAKTLSRKNIDLSNIVIGEKKIEIDTSPITVKWEINLNEFKIGLLKIAYEYATDIIPNYLDDDTAFLISKILKDANHEDVNKYVKIGNGLQHEIWEPFGKFLNFNSNSHYLLLASDESRGLVCLIKLHDLFAVGVTLSSQEYLSEGEMHVGINSQEKKKFIKLTSQELMRHCLGPRHTRFIFKLKYHYEAAEINFPLFRYDGQSNENIPLFTLEGKLICYIEKAIEKAKVDTVCHEDMISVTYYFSNTHNYHIKEYNTGKFYQVCGYNVEQHVIKKL